MEDLLIPSSVTYQELKDKKHAAEVIITPCYHGYGTTLGNMLRRVLLSSLPGAAVTSVKIKGVTHEFASIEGVQEDVVQVLLNLKKLRARVFADAPVKLSLKAKGAGAVKASQIDSSADVEIISEDLTIATLTDDKSELEMEIVFQRGRGYVPVEEREEENLELGMIAIDSVFSPVTDVGYSVEFTRVGDITNYEKLSLIIETDGTISPKDALDQSVKILMDHLSVIQSAEAASALEELESTVEESADTDVEVEGEAETEDEVKEKTEEVVEAKDKGEIEESAEKEVPAEE